MSIQVIDLIPFTDSAEAKQNSEPSLGINPANPLQMVDGIFSPAGASYFKSTDGGFTWSDYGSEPSADKTIAWTQDGSAVLTATIDRIISFNPFTTEIKTFSGTTAGSSFGPSINTIQGGFDQPWLRTGPSNHAYMAVNDLQGNVDAANTITGFQVNTNIGTNVITNGQTASVLVSTNGGANYNEVLIDHIGSPGDAQDGPSVRLAVNGNTVYAAFTHWTTLVENDANGARFHSGVWVVRSDNGGADNFGALGTGGNGVEVATPITYFANTSNTPLTLGQERTSSDLAIAVDPNNASHVVVVYGNAPGANGSGQLQQIVSESTDGGATWAQVFATSLTTREALPAVAITNDGTIGLLYGQYDPGTNTLSQHFLTTSDDFASTNDTVLGTESNATPAIAFHPYLGDFYDLTAIGNTFYGTFSASNQDDGTHASFGSATFLRNFTGTPGTASFQLKDTGGVNNVAASIDPFFFSVSTSPPPPPGVATVAISPLDANKAEGASGVTPFTFTVTRAGNTSGFITVTWTASGTGSSPADTSDFAGGLFPAGFVFFNPGETTKIITVNVLGDTQPPVEPDETFAVTLTFAVGATIINPTSVGTIHETAAISPPPPPPPPPPPNGLGNLAIAATGVDLKIAELIGLSKYDGGLHGA
jgi:hypothetical protein